MPTAIDHPPAGQKHAAPQLLIKELMDPPEKSAVWQRNRRELRVAVLLRVGCKPVYRLITGSSYEGMQKLPTYKTAAGVEYKGLSALEYVDLVKPCLQELKWASDGSELPPAKYFLHDKCPVHTALHARKELSKHIQVLQLPTDSPDLTPCDTSFFAAVKGRWQKGQARQPMPWAERCTLALNIISTTPFDKYITALPMRWQACINAEGWHIEQEYQVLKTAGKAD
jgi:hypothetical protein